MSPKMHVIKDQQGYVKNLKINLSCSAGMKILKDLTNFVVLGFFLKQTRIKDFSKWNLKGVCLKLCVSTLNY